MKNLNEYIIESEQQKPYIDTLPLVETLPNGLYEGQLNGYCFTYENKNYKSPIGILSIFPSPFNLEIQEGKVIRAGEPLKMFDYVYEENKETTRNLFEALDIKPEYGDGAADWSSDFYKESMQVLIDKCHRCWEYAEEQCAKYPDNCRACWSWSILGMVRPYLEMLIKAKREWYINNDIIEILFTALQDCESDPKFHEGWKDPKEFEASLKEQRELCNKINEVKLKLDAKYPDRDLKNHPKGYQKTLIEPREGVCYINVKSN